MTDIKAAQACCTARPDGQAGAGGSCCPPEKGKVGTRRSPQGDGPVYMKVKHDWTLKDHLGQVRSRLGSFRDSYSVSPGLYAIGEPDKGSDVFVSANYKLGFDMLRRALTGVSAWILVLDTKGVNVWCAAGKGTFGTDELVKKVYETRLFEVVEKRRLIVPQLGAPGVSAHEVKKQTGFHVLFGPVEAKDIKEYVGAGYKADRRMRTKEFPLKDRAVLVPMELGPVLKYFFAYVFLSLALSGLSAEGFDFAKALWGAYPPVILGAGALISGAVITPLLLPYVPFRAFALKGLVTGAIVTFGLAIALGLVNPVWLIVSMLFFPAISSYLAVQFTGASTYTNISGVKKELRYAIPAYIVSVSISALTFLFAKLLGWGLS